MRYHFFADDDDELESDISNNNGMQVDPSRRIPGFLPALDKALPFDILCRIFVLAQWPTLVYVSRAFYQVSKSMAVRAHYCLAEFGKKQVLDGGIGLAGKRPRMFRQNIVLMLLNMGADPRADDQWILRHACAQGWVSIVQKILQMRMAAPQAIPPSVQDAILDANNSSSSARAMALDNWRGGSGDEQYVETYSSQSQMPLVDIHDDDDAALRIAAGLGQLFVVRLLVAEGADVNALSCEPLALAASNGHLETARFLLSQGADAQADNSRALRSAVLAGDSNIECTQLLLDSGARAHAMDDSCILAACYKGDGEFPRPPPLPAMSASLPDSGLASAGSRQARAMSRIELLKYSYAGVSRDATLYNTPAIMAALPSSAPEMQFGYRMRRQPQRYRSVANNGIGLVAASGDHTQQQPSSPMQTACSSAMPPITPISASHSEQANLDVFMADSPVDTSDKIPAYAQHLLHTHIGVVRLLLARGANPNVRGGRPLIYACSRGSIRTAAVLMAYGADIHVQSDEPLREAAEHGHLGIVRLLLSAGADVHVSDEAPLHNAARGGHLEIVCELLAHGARADAQGGTLALRAAARGGWVAVVERLVLAGADATDAEFRGIALRSRGIRVALGMSEPLDSRFLF